MIGIPIWLEEMNEKGTKCHYLSTVGRIKGFHMRRKSHLQWIKRIAMVFFMLTLVVTMAGCSKKAKGAKSTEKVQKTDVKKEPDFILDADGSFTVIYEEDFVEDYYNKVELEAMVDSELKEFNENYAKDAAKGISKAMFTVEKGIAKLGLHFTEDEDYISYETNYVSSTRNARLYVGTYGELAQAGYHLPQRLTQTDGVTQVTEDSFSAQDGVYVIFTNQRFTMSVPGEVIAINSSAKVDAGSGAVYTSDKRENYIVFKKVEAQSQADAGAEAEQ